MPEGLVITLRRSKTDQDGLGRQIAIPQTDGPMCPVGALEVWLAAAGIEHGPVFRSVSRHGRIGARALCDRAVASIAKDLAAAAGLDPSRYSGHSLRAGLATSAAVGGVPSWIIQQQTGHTSEAMLQRYIRDGEMFRHNAAKTAL